MRMTARSLAALLRQEIGAGGVVSASGRYVRLTEREDAVGRILNREEAYQHLAAIRRARTGSTNGGQ